ncbi:hypothetical protein DPMN_141104 [Dreissena polymorpha]|uniref:Uncharacterized protein n=1 Tax=Dreissena polymorpha TaxID=45954 RepID=A0A9D4GC23_DREPO|nr:hypothetical protein DPMN_141104 [Dreissena polymorpha]
MKQSCGLSMPCPAPTAFDYPTTSRLETRLEKFPLPRADTFRAVSVKDPVDADRENRCFAQCLRVDQCLKA